VASWTGRKEATTGCSGKTMGSVIRIRGRELQNLFKSKAPVKTAPGSTGTMGKLNANRALQKR
jgi:hypothetical protein